VTRLLPDLKARAESGKLLAKLTFSATSTPHLASGSRAQGFEAASS
jgi:hypothetical protein